jgi:hypothetical protein
MGAPKLKHPPSIVQLPGGIRLSAVDFKVEGRDEQGRPVLFRLLPEGSTIERNDDYWALYANESALRGPRRP